MTNDDLTKSLALLAIGDSLSNTVREVVVELEAHAETCTDPEQAQELREVAEGLAGLVETYERRIRAHVERLENR